MLKGRQQENYQFSIHFDQQFLTELYGDDMRSAEEVFQSSIIQIHQELEVAETLFKKGNITEVRKIFHRIKPLFGYVGLLPVQDYIQTFEDNCIHFREIEGLALAFENLKVIILDASTKISEEKNRLGDYNKRRA